MIISVFPSGRQTAYCLPLPNIVRHIKTGTYKEIVTLARQHYRQAEGKRFREALSNIPSYSPAGHFKGSFRPSRLVSFSGCVLLETECLTPDLISEVRLIVENDPLTLACFQNVTGDQLQIIVRTGGSINNYRLHFHELVEHYEILLPLTLSLEHDYPFWLNKMSFDPEAYYNPGASSFMASLYAPPPEPPFLKDLMESLIPEDVPPSNASPVPLSACFTTIHFN